MTGLRKQGLLLIVSIMLVASAAAQDAQRFETFAGYSFNNGNFYLPGGANLSGWDSSTTVFLKRWIGITSDFAGHYGTGNFTLPSPYPPSLFTPETDRETAHVHTFLFGPHFTYRRSRYAPFVQTLFGVQHIWTSTTLLIPETCTPPVGCQPLPSGTTSSGSTNKFTMAAGGGLDIALGHGISLRPVQAEYLLDRVLCRLEVQQGVLHYRDCNDNVFRYSTGITFRFGEHLGKVK
jgi:opacity protein-like surface antigen